MRLSPRGVAAAAAMTVVGVAVSLVALSTGEYTVPIPDIVTSVFGRGTPAAELIVGKLRAPRVVTGLLVGAAFGLSGAILQSLTRNPLGSPDFLGFTAGASTGGIVAVVMGGSAWQIAAARCWAAWRARRWSTGCRSGAACRATGWSSSGSASARCWSPSTGTC
nr:hypothetical protein GCM10020093_109690 [Planobispora longispora]